MISEGHVEDDRIPDIRRCERLPLVLWIIENADAVANIDIREQARRRERNRMLWPDAMAGCYGMTNIIPSCSPGA